MRFTVINDLRKNQPMRWLLTGLMLLIVIFLVLHALLAGLQIGWTPSEVLDTIVGNEDAFIDPLPFEEQLLRVHTNLFFAMLVLAVVASAYVRTLDKPSSAIPIISILFGTALITQILLLLIPWFGIVGAWAWLIGMLSWHLLGAWIALITMIYLMRLR